MKIMLVSDSPELKPLIQESFSFRDTDVIHYDNPIKAMDNLDEIEPDIVIFAAVDFPRHWKPFAAYLRYSYSRRQTVFGLIIDRNFDETEVEKAEYLEVNAMLDDSLSSDQMIQRIRGIVTRYHQNLDIRSAPRYMPSTDDRIAFVFNNPYTLRIVPTAVVDISSGGLQVRPEIRATERVLDSYEIIRAASLRLGDSIMGIKLKVVRVSDTIAMEYVDLSLEAEQKISGYLTALTAQERRPPQSE